ncbi:MAG TPA: hypothetical protein VFA34_01960 [Actinomycetota bacterium]|nr:hypothetical protein [Actinomycetota bacterium]
MSVKSVELYEALKPHVGQEAAQMIAEVIPPAANIATREDIQSLRADIFKWGLTFYVPMWATTIALVIEMIRR